MSLEHHFLDVHDARLHYVRAGDGPLIVFLHGFPQTWYSLRQQLLEFSRDHLAVAMDLRGHGDSTHPDRIEQYGCIPSVRDLEALASELGYERFVLVGHDWGAAVAWATALHRPELLEALVVLCTPHPAAFDRAMRESPDQQQASAYLALCRREVFGDRRVAEILSEQDFALLRQQLEQPYITDEAMREYVGAWSKPGGVEAMLRWYRVHGIGPADEFRLGFANYTPEVAEPIVRVPTQVIYPDGDTFVRPAAHEQLDRWVPDLSFQVVPGGSHWIAEEQPEVVNSSIRSFLETRLRRPPESDARRE
jgi:pimeloyl-ACP methyl ester carboxylesterase